MKVYKTGKRLVLKKYKNKFRINKIPTTVITNYKNIGNYILNKNEQFIIDYKLWNLISEEQWNILMEEKY